MRWIRWKVGFLATMAATMGLTSLGVPPAFAGGTTCGWSAGLVTVTMSANGDNAFIVRSGAAILVNGAPCGAATVTNTDTINVTIDNATDVEDNVVTISDTGGPFRPGASAETPGTQPEIEWNIDFGYGFDKLVYLGSAQGNQVTVGNGGGTGAMNLNATESSPDADVLFDHFPSHLLVLKGAAGGDTLSASGGVGTGSPYPPFVEIYGGNGADTLRGGKANDYIEGGANGDKLRGGIDNDQLRGGSGNDSLFGEGGDDSLYGEVGADRAYGGLGADLVVGGPGHDQLYGDGGLDTIKAADGASDLVNAGPPPTGDFCQLDFIDNLVTC